MRLRQFITLVASVPGWRGLATTFLACVLSLAPPLIGYSEEPKKPIHIGVISFAEPGLRTHLDESLIQGLREKGYLEGVNLTIEWRYADGDRERVPQVAKDLAGMKLDAIVTTCTPTTRAMAAAAPTTPIIMAGVSDIDTPAGGSPAPPASSKTSRPRCSSCCMRSHQMPPR